MKAHGGSFVSFALALAWHMKTKPTSKKPVPSFIVREALFPRVSYGDQFFIPISQKKNQGKKKRQTLLCLSCTWKTIPLIFKFIEQTIKCWPFDKHTGRIFCVSGSHIYLQMRRQGFRKVPAFSNLADGYSGMRDAGDEKTDQEFNGWKHQASCKLSDPACK